MKTKKIKGPLSLEAIANLSAKKDIFITEGCTVKDAFKKLDQSALKVLLVINDDNKLLGTITDGDIRRHILRGSSIDSDILEVYNKKPLSIDENEKDKDVIDHLFLKHKVEVLPVVNQYDQVVDFITWDETLNKDAEGFKSKAKLDVPVAIMAGGKGTRLDPFSKIFPKPLIPVGEHPIIEIIVNRFLDQGIDQFYFLLNYKAEMIKSYFDYVDKKYNLHYVYEKELLGTASSLKLLPIEIHDNFIVSNCDVIVNADLSVVLKEHREKNAMLTVLSSIQHHKIPYGVIDFKEGGEVTRIREKPEYTCMVNTGVYILNKQVFKYIPENQHFDMPDLIQALIDDKQLVLTFPVNENDYIDVGQWEEYKKAVDKLKFLG